MEKESVLIQGITVEQLIGIVQKIIRSEIERYAKKEQQERLLSPADTCKLFTPAISKVTLARWTKIGKLKDYRIGGRVFYKSQEILEAATHLKRYKVK